MEDSIDVDPTLPSPSISTDAPPESTNIITQPSPSPSYHPFNEQRPIGIFHWNTNEANALWLAGWIPTMEYQYLSACLGLFLMAIVARGLGAINIFLTTWLRAKDYNQLPITTRNNKKITSTINSPSNIYNKRNSRASMFLQQQQWNNSSATTSVRQSTETNRQNNNSIIINDESDNNTTRRSFMTPATSTVVTTSDSSPSSSRQQEQQAQQQIPNNRSTKEFTLINLSDNNGDKITTDNPPMEESDDDATSYVSAASTPYSINNKRTRKLSTRTLGRYYSTATSFNKYKHVINSNRKSVEQPQQQHRQSILFSSTRPLTTTTSRRFMESFEKAKIPWSPRFEWITDTLSSVLTTLEYFLMFLLTMTVMTGNVLYLVSILLGIFIGEMISGRLRGSIHQLPIHNNYDK